MSVKSNVLALAAQFSWREFRVYTQWRESPVEILGLRYGGLVVHHPIRAVSRTGVAKLDKGTSAPLDERTWTLLNALSSSRACGASSMITW